MNINRKVRTWLKQNKVYFDTLAPVSIGIAAFFVALASYNLTNQQVKLADKQLELSLLNIEPNIYLKEVHIIDPVTKLSTETELRIFNSGEEVRNFKKSVKTFLEIEHISMRGKVFIYIPIIGYYGTGYYSSEPTGELARASGYKNNEIFSNFYLDFQASNLKNKYGYTFINLKHLTKINYTNKLGLEGEEYFIGTQSVSSIEYQKLNSYFKIDDFVDIENLSLSIIEEKLKNLS